MQIVVVGSDVLLSLLKVLNDVVEAGPQLQELLVVLRELHLLVIHCPNHHLSNR